MLIEIFIPFMLVYGCIALQVKDQQEAERKKVTSQEIQQALQEQTKVISQKQLSVKHDLSQVEPAVIEAQNGKPTYPNLKLYHNA